MWIKTSECIESSRARTTGGYCVQRILGRGLQLVHRLAWEAEHGPIPEGMLVLHHCDNPPCYNIQHLFLGTHADNLADAQAKGRVPIPEHGRWSMYTKHGCRCILCRAANAEHCLRQYHLRNPSSKYYRRRKRVAQMSPRRKFY